MSFEDRVFDALTFGLQELPKTGFKILLRRDGFGVAGIVTVKKPEFDPSLGESRMWAHGVKLNDGEFFKEPLDRKDPKLREIESVVLAETPHLILTARRSLDLDDDGKNFMFLDNPLAVEEVRKIEEEIKVQSRVISTVSIELKNERKEKRYWMDLASSQGDAVREGEERIGRLSKDVSLLRNQLEHYRLLAEAAQAYGVMAQSALDKMLEDARRRGVELASTETERTIEAAKQQRKLLEELSPLIPRGVSPEEVEKVRLELEETRKRIKELEKKPSAPAPTSTPAPT